jgi:hypothetical protein
LLTELIVRVTARLKTQYQTDSIHRFGPIAPRVFIQQLTVTETNPFNVNLAPCSPGLARKQDAAVFKNNGREVFVVMPIPSNSCMADVIMDVAAVNKIVV